MRGIEPAPAPLKEENATIDTYSPNVRSAGLEPASAGVRIRYNKPLYDERVLVFLPGVEPGIGLL